MPLSKGLRLSLSRWPPLEISFARKEKITQYEMRHYANYATNKAAPLLTEPKDQLFWTGLCRVPVWMLP